MVVWIRARGCYQFVLVVILYSLHFLPSISLQYSTKVHPLLSHRKSPLHTHELHSSERQCEDRIQPGQVALWHCVHCVPLLRMERLERVEVRVYIFPHFYPARGGLFK